MPLQLHVFEKRYQQLVQDCLKTDRQFGVVLIQRGSEALGPLPEPYSVGCSAHIMDIKPLSQGRLNLMVVGRERIRIHSFERQSAPYLIGKVEPYPLKYGDMQSFKNEAAHMRPRIEQYKRLLVQMSDLHKEPEPLPGEDEMIGYLAAILLQAPLQDKQALLEAESAIEQLTILDGILNRELPLMKALLAESSRSGIGVFSRN
jgi:Lon protease-like protein